MLLQKWTTGWLVACVALGLVAFPGCEDDEARQKAAEASKQAENVKLELAKMTEQNKELAAKIQAVQDQLAQQLAQRMDKLSELVAAQTKDALDKIIVDSQQTRTAAVNAAEDVRRDYKKDLEGLTTSVAGDMQKVRDQITATGDDLKKFMDNQLRDLYPYAFQPHRTEPLTTSPANAK